MIIRLAICVKYAYFSFQMRKYKAVKKAYLVEEGIFA